MLLCVLPWITFAEPPLTEICVLSKPRNVLPMLFTKYVCAQITTSPPAGFVSPVKAVWVVASSTTVSKTRKPRNGWSTARPGYSHWYVHSLCGTWNAIVCTPGVLSDASPASASETLPSGPGKFATCCAPPKSVTSDAVSTVMVCARAEIADKIRNESDAE
ncbi:MAG: hypothetical protein K8S98_04735 [Planctomycetes bacterium]|nr:hypothetical protein [Planctomycetota bacterium]